VPFQVIYVDQVVLGSMVMNYVILYTVGKIGGVTNVRWRMVIAAALGGLYSIAAFVPAFSPLMTVWFKTLASVIIIIVAFAPLPPIRLATCLAFFYLTSFALGGSVIGIMYFLEAQGGVGSFPQSFPSVLERYFWHAIVLALGVFGAAGKGTALLFKRRYRQSLFKIPLVIKVCDKQVQTEGFLDSGNQLTDPLTGNPVIVAEYEVIKSLLPRELITYLDNNRELDPVKAMMVMQDSLWGAKFRLIPFQSLGKDAGMLLGFDPDQVELQYGHKTICSTGVTVAICLKTLSPDADYNVLVHPGLLGTDIS